MTGGVMQSEYPIPPTDEEVETLLRTVLQRVVRLLKRRGKLDEDAYPENALEALRAASLQCRLPFPEHDRENLERLCRYG